MKKMPRFIIVCLCLLLCQVCSAQEHPRFYEDIHRFKQADSAHFPSQHMILFVGSSSFTKWTDVQSYFPEYPIINRGFGGSTLPDVIRYANDIIFPYKPRQVVIYCGENDFQEADSPSVQTVFDRFKKLFYLVRSKMPGENIVFISLKPSPSRAGTMPKEEAVNEMAKSFLAKQKNAAFVDVYHKMLGKDGKPIPEIFIEDNLHMNAKGYAIWRKAIEPYLMKNDK
jgi:lysophospholipase L1-like esterase